MKKIIKRFIMSSILIYSYNLLAANLNMIVPINLITLLIVSFLGIPGFFMLVFFRIFV